jgi:hypothetical protein
MDIPDATGLSKNDTKYLSQAIELSRKALNDASLTPFGAQELLLYS